jgi:hypothetical protein
VPARATPAGCRGLLEPATEEKGFANSVQIGCPAIAGAEAQVSLKRLEREVGLPGKNSEQTAEVPPARMARVEGEATVNQPQRNIDVLAEISEDKGREP